MIPADRLPFKAKAGVALGGAAFVASLVWQYVAVLA